MADGNKVNIGKVRKLLEELEAVEEKGAALRLEVASLLGGGVGIGQLLRRAELAYSDAWKTRYGTFYVWSYAKDRPNLKRLILQLGIVELEARMVRYIASSEDFVAKNRHPFGVFVSSVNSYAAAAESPETAAGEFDLDSDADATRRRSEALRSR